MSEWRDHPEYSEGFYDARDFTPLYPDASEPYRAGWEAFWRCHQILVDAGFSRSGAEYSKTTVVEPRPPLALYRDWDVAGRCGNGVA